MAPEETKETRAILRLDEPVEAGRQTERGLYSRHPTETAISRAESSVDRTLDSVFQKIDSSVQGTQHKVDAKVTAPWEYLPKKLTPRVQHSHAEQVNLGSDSAPAGVN